MTPSSTSRRRVSCRPEPRNVSGAQPTRTPAASAAFSSAWALARSTVNGFSFQTCLPALTAWLATSAWAFGWSG